jgi:hypothetical protein
MGMSPPLKTASIWSLQFRAPKEAALAHILLTNAH